MIQRIQLATFFAITFFTLSRAAALDPFEIQVYDGRINDPGQYSLETHFNRMLSGPTRAAVDEPSTAGQNHLTFEFARGVTPYWEIGFYLQSAWLASGEYQYAGAKLRSKFVVPESVAGHWHLGANIEIAKIPQPFDDSSLGGEIRPVVGYSDLGWSILFNPIVDLPNFTPAFEPGLKVMYEAVRHSAIGFEYYSDLGLFSNLVVLKDAEQYAFLTYDLIDGPFELNIGFGRGLTESANQHVAKMIVGFDFN